MHCSGGRRRLREILFSEKYQSIGAMRVHGHVVPSALEAARDAELVEKRLRLEIGDPDRGGLAALDGPVLGDLDHGVAAREAEIHQRHHAVVFRQEDVVAEPSEVEDIGQVRKDFGRTPRPDGSHPRASSLAPLW
jgi:hypothetical protein